MALLGWGSPTLIEAELGIILEVPSPIRLVLLGQLNMILPDPDAAIVEIHIDILGILDFVLRTAFHRRLDARLRSPPLPCTATWRSGLAGENDLDLLFQSVASIRTSSRRLSFQCCGAPPSLWAWRQPAVSLQSYMAVTSNSIQFGAQAELYAAGRAERAWLDVL
jgi:hypothetical protein